jgi:hypothetical protein
MLSRIFFIFLISIAFYGCKKDIIPGNSKNEITLRINGGTPVVYEQSSYNPATEKFSNYSIGFARTYYTTATRESQKYNIVEFSLRDSSIFSRPLPYTVKKYAMFIESIVPNNLGIFYHDSTDSIYKGNVQITITSISEQRLVGTYSGVIYSTYNQPPQPGSINVTGTFDVILPAYSNY